MKRLDRWLSLGLVLTLGFLLGMLGFSLWDKIPSPVQRVAWSPEAQWIAPQQPSYRLYARRTFDLPDTVQSGWLRLSADNDFILYVNGQPIAQELSVFAPALGLGSKLSEPFQGFNDSVAYRFGLEWIHLSQAKDWKLTTYIDLIPYLRPGEKNSIALEIQKAQKNPRVVVEGAIYRTPESPAIALTTGATPWRVSVLSENRQGLRWFDREFPDENWPEAKAIGSVQEATYSRLSQQLFDRPLQGTWITGTESSQGEVWLRGNWQVPEVRRRAFLRFAGDGKYALLINGRLVNHYGISDRNQLYLYEVTNFLHTGVNTLAVRLARPLDPGWSSAHNGTVGFLLDGWVETDQGNSVAAIATDNTWSALTQPIEGWAEGSQELKVERSNQSFNLQSSNLQHSTLLQPATRLESANPQELQRHFEGNAYLLNYPDYLWHQSLWQLGGMAFALVYAWSLGRFWLGNRDNWWDSFGAGTALLLPGTLFLIGMGLLKHRYAEAEKGLLFAQPQSNSLILLGFVAIALLTLLWSQFSQRLGTQPRWSLWFLFGLVACVGLGLAAGRSTPLILLVVAGIVIMILLWIWGRWHLKDRRHALHAQRKDENISPPHPLTPSPSLPLYFQASDKTIRRRSQSWGKWFLLVLIVAIGFGLRAYNLGSIIEPDENTSFDATIGILRTGFPKASSGIWYTRGPFYHYLLALWLWVVGDSVVNARFLSVICGTANLILVFIFTRKITGKFWAALVVTAILAIDPIQIWYSRFIRFYEILQFLTIFSCWSFLKGFIEREGRTYQYCFFIALTLTMLTQELTITLLPCFLIGGLLFYRPFRLSVDWPIILSSLMTLVIYVYNGLAVSIRTLTPLVAISASTESMLRLSLVNATGFVSVLLVGPNRMFILYSFFFILGFVYFVKLRDKKIVFWFCFVFLYVIVLTLVVFQSNLRYLYNIYPLFLLLSIYSAICLIQSLGQYYEILLNSWLPLRTIALGFVALLLIGNIELDRLLASYQNAITVRNPEIVEYIREHREPGDIVIATIPMLYPPKVKLDYYIRHRISFFDAVYLDNGRLIDRWAGGVVINNVDQISHILEKANRVWIHTHDHQRPQDRKLATFYNYYQNLGQPVLETFGARLRLWQRKDGILPRLPNEGKDLGNY